MRPRIRPRIKYGDQEWNTRAEVGGYEQDVLVKYETSPAEPDVNWTGGLEVTGVYFEDQGDVMGDMTDDELEQLTMRVNEYENDRHNPENQY